MKIVGVEISNFKRLHSLRIQLDTVESNLVFINGSNGNGKSSLLKSFHWCFFGDKISERDFSYAELEKLESEDTSNISVQVRLQINQNGDLATIRRDQPVRINKEGTDSSVNFLGPEDLTVTLAYANTSIPSEIVPDGATWLEANFPHRFKKFILFDGELMYSFFENSVKGAIEEAVREIAKIDLFDEVTTRIQGILTQNNLKVGRLSGIVAEKIGEELESNQSLYDTNQSKIRQKRIEKERCEVDIRNIEEALRGTEELDKFLEANKDLQVKLREQEALNAEHYENLTKILMYTGTHNLMVTRTKYPLEKQVKEAERTGKYPANFAPGALGDLLAAGNCICGRHLDSGSNESKQIMKIIEDSNDAGEIGSQLKKIEVGVAKLDGTLQEKLNTKSMVIADVKRTEQEMTRLKREIDRLKPRLEGVKGNREDILKLSQKLKELRRALPEIKNEELLLLVKLRDIKTQIDVLKRKFDKALGNSKEVDELKTRRIFLEKVLEQASTFSDEIISNVRNNLQTAIESKFTKVQGCENFSVVLSENFDIEPFNSLGKKPDLSDGQKMSLAYIFSIALREVVGLSFPLIVDTPFGRLSTRNRSVIADSLRRLVEDGRDHQVILMMHDGEYSPYTKKDFSLANPVEYYLALSENQLESNMEFGIDPDWQTRDAWKDWAEGNIRI